jgi:hypothetical protein
VTSIADLAASIIAKSAPREPLWKRRERLRRLNGGSYVEPVGGSTPLTTRLRQRPQPTPRLIIVRPIINVETQKAAPPVINVRVDSTPKATRTRVVKTDEDGIAVETVTEPVE